MQHDKQPKVHGLLFPCRFVDTSKDTVKSMEQWKDIKGFEGAYMISTTGKVLSLPRPGTQQKEPILRSLSLTKDGYKKVRLIGNGKDVTARVHRLVAEAFVPNPDNLETVNHIDGNKTNNNVENLEWADRHEQMYHAYKNNLKKPMRGTENANAKLTADQVSAIRKEYVRQSKEFGTVALARKYGVTNAAIGMIVRGVSYV